VSRMHSNCRHDGRWRELNCLSEPVLPKKLGCNDTKKSIPFRIKGEKFAMTSNLLIRPKVVSRAEWLVARKELLAQEKRLTRERDEISRQRRALPWVKVEKNYVFVGPEGEITLAQLFSGRSQLIVSHFMLGPGWKEGCVGCSFRSDHVEGALVHLEHHDVSFVTISRAPLEEIEAFKHRMG
jgi:predicted dithiol-disulfide oxidoreductase (DUF899 family)